MSATKSEEVIACLSFASACRSSKHCTLTFLVKASAKNLVALVCKRCDTEALNDAVVLVAIIYFVSVNYNLRIVRNPIEAHMVHRCHNGRHFPLEAGSELFTPGQVSDILDNHDVQDGTDFLVVLLELLDREIIQLFVETFDERGESFKAGSKSLIGLPVEMNEVSQLDRLVNVV